MGRSRVLHTNALDYVEHLARLLEAVVPRWEQLVGGAGVAIASHAGPGVVGIACVPAGREAICRAVT